MKADVLRKKGVQLIMTRKISTDSVWEHNEVVTVLDLQNIRRNQFKSFCWSRRPAELL